MSEFLRRTARESGVRGLFRGATPTLAMITPQMGVSFAVWEALKGGAPPAFSGSGSGASPAATLSWQLGAGMVAGMVGKLVVFPLDTVKKRVQTAVRTRIHGAEEGGGGSFAGETLRNPTDSRGGAGEDALIFCMP